jgi:hypothetical protein
MFQFLYFDEQNQEYSFNYDWFEQRNVCLMQCSLSTAERISGPGGPPIGVTSMSVAMRCCGMLMSGD